MTKARARARTVRETRAHYSVGSSAPVVVDASIAFRWFAVEAGSEEAAGLLRGDAMLLAPDFMIIEAANAWWKRSRRGNLDRADVEQAVTNLLAIGIVWVPAVGVLTAAVRLAGELRHPVYDCIYLALARARGAALATADDRLRVGAERLGVPLWDARRRR